MKHIASQAYTYAADQTDRLFQAGEIPSEHLDEIRRLLQDAYLAGATAALEASVRAGALQ